MYLNIDSGRLEQHIDLLYAEKRVAERIVMRVREWNAQGALDPTFDPAFVSKQMARAENQLEYIRSRIKCLEVIIEKHVEMIKKSSHRLDDADRILDAFTKLL